MVDAVTRGDPSPTTKAEQISFALPPPPPSNKAPSPSTTWKPTATDSDYYEGQSAHTAAAADPWGGDDEASSTPNTPGGAVPTPAGSTPFGGGLTGGTTSTPAGGSTLLPVIGLDGPPLKNDRPGPPAAGKTDVSVGTLNIYGGGNVMKGDNMSLDPVDTARRSNTLKAIKDYANGTDIIGFQEVDDAKAKERLNEILKDTHDSFYGDSGNPIFWKKDKFELVHSETLEIHKAGEFGSDQRRTTNIVILKDKKTGALLTIANRHMDTDPVDDKATPEGKNQHMMKTDARLKELEKAYPIDATINVGDYNMALPTMNYHPQDDYEDKRYLPRYTNDKSYDTASEGALSDHIQAKGNTRSPIEGQYSYGNPLDNGDFYKGHYMMRGNLKIPYANNPQKSDLKNIKPPPQAK